MAPTKYPMALSVFQLNDIEHKNGQRKKRFHIRAHKAFGIFYGTWNCAESTIFVAISLSHPSYVSLTPCVFVQSVLFFQRVFWFVGEQQPLLHLAQNDEMPSKMWNDSIFWTWHRNFFFQAIFIFVCLQFQSKMPVLLLSGINSMNTQAEREKKRKRQTRKKKINIKCAPP